MFSLPKPNTMIGLSQKFSPVMINGIKVDPKNPFHFDFIVNSGDTKIGEGELKNEANKLIKYFLTSLTVPEKELWVNLSPYEKDRIIPESFGLTEMGRDLLTQDYLLKQITSSMMYPESDLGQEFWDKVYQKAHEQFGKTNIPTDTFNKVWIVPDKAVVYENDQTNTAFIVESHLRVMLESDYIAMNGGKEVKNTGPNTSIASESKPNLSTTITSNIIKQIIIPELEKEVNTGKNFANLRQITNSLILATWYKKRLKDSLIGKAYVDKNKIIGVDVKDKEVKFKIYDQYLESFKKGVYDFVKEDFDYYSQQIIPRKYFSGGYNAAMLSLKITKNVNSSQIARSEKNFAMSVNLQDANARYQNQKQPDAAMSSRFKTANSSLSVKNQYKRQKSPVFKKIINVLSITVSLFIAGKMTINSASNFFKEKPEIVYEENVHATDKLFNKLDEINRKFLGYRYSADLIPSLVIGEEVSPVKGDSFDDAIAALVDDADKVVQSGIKAVTDVREKEKALVKKAARSKEPIASLPIYVEYSEKEKELMPKIEADLTKYKKDNFEYIFNADTLFKHFVLALYGPVFYMHYLAPELNIQIVPIDSQAAKDSGLKNFNEFLRLINNASNQSPYYSVSNKVKKIKKLISNIDTKKSYIPDDVDKEITSLIFTLGSKSLKDNLNKAYRSFKIYFRDGMVVRNLNFALNLIKLNLDNKNKKGICILGSDHRVGIAEIFKQIENFKNAKTMKLSAVAKQLFYPEGSNLLLKPNLSAKDINSFFARLDNKGIGQTGINGTANALFDNPEIIRIFNGYVPMLQNISAEKSLVNFDGAMITKNPINTGENRNTDTQKIIASDLLYKILKSAGLNLYKGKHKIFNIGAGAEIHDTKELNDALMQKYHNSDIQMFGTEQKSVLATAEIPIGSLLSDEIKSEILTAANTRITPSERISKDNIFEIKLIATFNESEQKSIIDELRIGYTDAENNKWFETVASSGFYLRQGKPEFKKPALFKKVAGLFDIEALETIINKKEQPIKSMGISRIEYSPLINKFKASNLNFSFTEDIGETIKNEATMAVLSNVLIHLKNDSARTIFLKKINSSLKDGGIIVVKNAVNRRTEYGMVASVNLIDIYQKIAGQSLPEYLGSLTSDMQRNQIYNSEENKQIQKEITENFDFIGQKRMITNIADNHPDAYKYLSGENASGDNTATNDTEQLNAFVDNAVKKLNSAIVVTNEKEQRVFNLKAKKVESSVIVYLNDTAKNHEIMFFKADILNGNISISNSYVNTEILNVKNIVGKGIPKQIYSLIADVLPYGSIWKYNFVEENTLKTLYNNFDSDGNTIWAKNDAGKKPITILEMLLGSTSLGKIALGNKEMRNIELEYNGKKDIAGFKEFLKDAKRLGINDDDMGAFLVTATKTDNKAMTANNEEYILAEFFSINGKKILLTKTANNDVDLTLLSRLITGDKKYGYKILSKNAKMLVSKNVAVQWQHISAEENILIGKPNGSEPMGTSIEQNYERKIDDIIIVGKMKDFKLLNNFRDVSDLKSETFGIQNIIEVSPASLKNRDMRSYLGFANEIKQKLSKAIYTDTAMAATATNSTPQVIDKQGVYLDSQNPYFIDKEGMRFDLDKRFFDLPEFLQNILLKFNIGIRKVKDMEWDKMEAIGLPTVDALANFSRQRIDLRENFRFNKNIDMAVAHELSHIFDHMNYLMEKLPNEDDPIIRQIASLGWGTNNIDIQKWREGLAQGGRTGIIDEALAESLAKILLNKNSERKTFSELYDFFQKNLPNVFETKVGGIDLDPTNTDLQLKGNAIKFDMPFTEDNYKNVEFDGFVPVIFNVTPITDLPLYLGVVEKEQTVKKT